MSSEDTMDISSELAACAAPPTKKEKVKREKKTEFAPGVPVSTRSVWNRIFLLLQSEAQCRDVSPLILAQLTSVFESGIAVVIGENSERFNEHYFASQKKLLAELNQWKLEKSPIDVTSQIFHYETIRPKRERDPNAPPPKRAKRAAAPTTDTDSESEDEVQSTQGGTEKKPEIISITTTNRVYDSEGNVIIKQ